MDKKLEAYRARKQREEMLSKTKDRLSSLIRFNKSKVEDDSLREALVSEPLDDGASPGDDWDVASDTSSIDDSLNCCTYADVIYYALCFCLWAAVYVIFIKLEFGIIYLIVSALIGMYLNTGTRKRKRNEVSAYSVFNKNCESIDGTLKAEQLERQLIYGRLT